MVNNFVTRLSSLWNAGVQLSRGPIARASALSLGIRLVGLGLSFLQAILTARLLGPVGYGTVASIISVAQILATLAAFGLGPLAVREVPAMQAAGKTDRIRGFLGVSAILVAALASLLSLIAVLLILPATGAREAEPSAAMLGGLLVMPLTLIMLLAGWWRSFGAVGQAQFPNSILRPGIITLVLVASIAWATPIGPADYLVTALMAALFAGFVSLVWLWRTKLRVLPKSEVRNSLRDIGLKSVPFLGLALSAIVQTELLTVMLAVLSGPYETGLYQPVARLVPLLMLPVEAAGMRYAPRMAELHRMGEMDRMRRITWTFTWTTALLTALFGITVAAAGPWILAVFGREFVASAPLLWIIVAAQIFNASCGPVTMLLAMTGHSRTALWGQLAGLAVIGFSGVLLIADRGAMGAAMAMAIGIVFTNVCQWISVRRKLGMRPSLLRI